MNKILVLKVWNGILFPLKVLWLMVMLIGILTYLPYLLLAMKSTNLRPEITVGGWYGICAGWLINILLELFPGFFFLTILGGLIYLAVRWSKR